MPKVLVLHGPNLNLLGKRQPALYGLKTLAEINADLHKLALKLGHELASFQSNAEHELIDKIHECVENNTDLLIFNPAAFTHSSIALRDAILAVDLPLIEVHLSDISHREAFRQHSYFSDIAAEVIAGQGAKGYMLALQHVDEVLIKNRKRDLK